MTEKLTPEIIHFNYYPGGMQEDFPERWEERIVGQKGVTEIKEHAAVGDGDKWFWDVHYENNQVERIFYPHQVFYTKTIQP
jgi:hypothetical protein